MSAAELSPEPPFRRIQAKEPSMLYDPLQPSPQRSE